MPNSPAHSLRTASARAGAGCPPPGKAHRHRHRTRKMSTAHPHYPTSINGASIEFPLRLRLEHAEFRLLVAPLWHGYHKLAGRNGEERGSCTSARRQTLAFAVIVCVALFDDIDEAF